MTPAERVIAAVRDLDAAGDFATPRAVATHAGVNLGYVRHLLARACRDGALCRVRADHIGGHGAAPYLYFPSAPTLPPMPAETTP